jgi:chemotaxis protein methyltransferase CheR
MASNANNDLTAEDYQALQLALQDSLGVVVGDEGRDLITGKLKPLMTRERLSRLSELASALRKDSPSSIRSDVLEAITTHNTRWFGYHDIYRLMTSYILPALLEKQRTECRFWVVGCGQGQSAYSLAMVIDDCKQQLASEIAVEIVATDTADTLIEKAETGIYENAELEGLPQSKHRRYLDKVGDGQGESWQVNESIRSMLHFKSIDLLQDTLALGHFDVIISPDLLIYFSVALKAKLLDEFASLLEPSGILVVNPNEPIVPFCSRFDLVDHEAGRFYRQLN